MRKILAIVVPLVLIGSLASCSDTDTGGGNSLSADPTVVSAEPSAKIAGPIEISVTVGTDIDWMESNN